MLVYKMDHFASSRLFRHLFQSVFYRQKWKPGGTPCYRCPWRLLCLCNEVLTRFVFLGPLICSLPLLWFIVLCDVSASLWQTACTRWLDLRIKVENVFNFSHYWLSSLGTGEIHWGVMSNSHYWALQWQQTLFVGPQ